MTYFGKYLLDQKLITDEQHFNAIKKTQESSKTFLWALCHKGFLDALQISSLVTRSALEKKDIFSIIKDDGLLNDEQLNDVFKHQSKSSMSLGKALVEIGALDQDKLGEALSNFIKNSDTSLENVVQKVETISESTEAVDINEDDKLKITNLERDHSGEELDDFEIDFSGEFLNVFDDEELSKMSSEIEEINMLDDYQSIISDLHNRTTTLLGASKLAGLKLCHKLLSGWEEVLKTITKSDGENLDIDNFKQDFNESLQILWSIREGIKEGKNEKNIFEDSDLKNRYLNNIKNSLGYIK